MGVGQSLQRGSSGQVAWSSAPLGPRRRMSRSVARFLQMALYSSSRLHWLDERPWLYAACMPNMSRRRMWAMPKMSVPLPNLRSTHMRGSMNMICKHTTTHANSEHKTMHPDRKPADAIRPAECLYCSLPRSWEAGGPLL